ncbi:saccharopine dehydrogenase [Cladochytrium replicatum]|nr:saccharopine dehydrogenase [Cladochytrium replicatum]
MSPERPYDILVWGATGFTGKLVAEYLVTKYHDVPIALGGRSRSKLEAVAQYIGAPNIPLLVADASDSAALDQIVRKARVVISTVGPFAIHGIPLVESAVRSGTHYCDTTGETDFIAEAIERVHEKARGTGVRVVPSCGFDSIPSDMCALLLATHFRSKYGEDTAEVRMSSVVASGGFSGGTLHSALGAFEKQKKPSKDIADPYILVEKEKKALIKSGNSSLPVGPLIRYDSVLKQWQGYFMMEFINTRYVWRSHSILNYGPKFTYSETMQANPIAAFVLAVSLPVAVVLLYLIKPLRDLLKWLVPQGAGPSEITRNTGFFVNKAAGVSESGRKAIATIMGQNDPGYNETAKLVAEAALCMVFDGDALAASAEGKDVAFPVQKGGVLTAASAMGMTLVERLKKAGMVFEVRDLRA